jgi:hypothetical protein
MDLLNMLMIGPTQRLARYPLLLREVLKYSTSEHRDHSDLNLALKCFADLCVRVNAAKAEEDKRTRRVFLEQNAVVAKRDVHVCVFFFFFFFLKKFF